MARADLLGNLVDRRLLLPLGVGLALGLGLDVAVGRSHRFLALDLPDRASLLGTWFSVSMAVSP